MTVEERHVAILDALSVEGALSYEDLAQRLGVAQITARRDVEALADRGEVIKILGGAQRARAPSAFYETPLYDRLQTNRHAKQAISRRVLELIQPGMTLNIDGSTTCIELAGILAQELEGLTIVTPSCPVAMELGCSRRHEVVTIGGRFDADTCCATGVAAEAELQAFHADLAVISTKAFLPAEGTFESVLPNIRVKRVAVERAERVVLLADASKFGSRALCRAIRTEEIDTVVTDAAPSAEDAAALERAGVEVLLARGG
jgi:DeoR/GlpR family transcriptional regulator of sugar metabolism